MCVPNEKNNKIVGWILLWLAAVIYFFANLQKVIIPGAAFDELQQAFNLDAAGVTRLGSTLLYVYAFFQLIAGILADRFGGVRVIIIGGLVFCTGSLLSSLQISLPLLYFSRAITGMGAAAVYLSVIKEIGRVASNAMAMLIGIITIIGYSGAIAGATPFMTGIDKFGYTPMMLGTGIAALMVYLAYCLISTKDNFPPVCKDVKFSIKTYWLVLKSRQNCMMYLATGISFGTYFALQSILGKKFLEDFGNMTPEGAGLVMTATMLIAAVNGFIVASITPFIGNRRLPTMLFSGFGCLVGTLMIFSMIYFKLDYKVAVGGMLLMAFAGNVSPVYVALLRESNYANSFGTAVSVGNCFSYGISAVFGGLAGVLMDVFEPQIVNNTKVYGQNSYLLVFGVFVVLGIISSIASMLVKESKGRTIVEEL